MAKSKDDFTWLDDTGSSKYTAKDLTTIKEALELQGAKFILSASEKIRAYQSINTGKLLTKGLKTKYTLSGGEQALELYMIYYGDFVNKGVKGWGDSSNAPDSPYQYKTKGMSKEGRQSIKNAIESGKMKVRNVSGYKVGLETKSNDKKSLIDTQVDTMVYLIKKYGIKKRPFFSEAFEETFGTFPEELKKAIGKDLVVKILKMNTQK